MVSIGVCNVKSRLAKNMLWHFHKVTNLQKSILCLTPKHFVPLSRIHYVCRKTMYNVKLPNFSRNQSAVYLTPLALDYLSGHFEAPSNFSVNISNTSNTTFLLSWGAPFSLDVTDSPDISYYTLCANITIYGCKNISSHPDCTFPRRCTSSIDFTDPSLNGTNGGQNKTIMDYGDQIHFIFFADNRAAKATLTYLIKIELV